MSRPTKRPSPPVKPRWIQTELFPRPLVVDRLDPQLVGGERTRVTGVYLVREHAAAPSHRVFNDRHGWYCEEHGTRCDMVGALQRALAPNAAS